MLSVVAALFLTGFALVIVHWLLFLASRPKNLPPEPFPLPLVGSVWVFFGRDTCSVFQSLYDKYGDAVTIYAGCSMTGMQVILLGWDSIVEVATDKEIAKVTSDRPFGISKLRGVKEGILWAQYATASQSRQLLQKSFRQFGMLSSNLSPLQEDEISRLFSYIGSNTNRPIKLDAAVTEAVSSCVVIAIYSRRFDLNDKDCATVLATIKSFASGSFLLLAMLPYLKFIVPFMQDPMAKAEREFEGIMEKWLTKEMKIRRPHFNPENASDILDVYMSTNPSDKLDDAFLRSMVDAFAGSLDTSTLSILWALFYLAHMPDEQDRLFKEIESVVPSNSYPSRGNRENLPRLEAFLEESARYSCVSLQSFPRRCSEAIAFGPNKRYKLPEDTTVTLAWYPCHFDEKYWLDPKNFRVDRWLDPITGKLLPSVTHSLPFGIGRRACPGEQIARNLVFLCVGTFVQRFKWQLAEYVPFEATRIAFSRDPPEFRLVFSNRT